MEPSDPRLVALADLGYKFANLVIAAHRLGHANYAMTAHYVHQADSATSVVLAVATGDADAGIEALDSWLAGTGVAGLFEYYLDADSRAS